MVGALPADFAQGTKPDAKSPSGLLLRTARRLFTQIIAVERKKWGRRISRLPWTKEETKAHIKRKYLIDEMEVLSILAGEGSLACRVHAELNLTRALTKGTLPSLAGNRKHQMIFASVACGTFFKYYEKKDADCR